MHEYHLNLILDADLSTAQLNAEKEAVSAQLARHEGAEIVATDEWGVRRLAYEINKTQQGYYIIYTMRLPSTAPKAIESALRLRDNVMRVLVVRIRPERQTLQAERRRSSSPRQSRGSDRAETRPAARPQPAREDADTTHTRTPKPEATTPTQSEQVTAPSES